MEISIDNQMIDVTGAKHDVEVSIKHDGKVLWVNVDGICRLRVSQIDCNIRVMRGTGEIATFKHITLSEPQWEALRTIKKHRDGDNSCKPYMPPQSRARVFEALIRKGVVFYRSKSDGYMHNGYVLTSYGRKLLVDSEDLEL